MRIDSPILRIIAIASLVVAAQTSGFCQGWVGAPVNNETVNGAVTGAGNLSSAVASGQAYSAQSGGLNYTTYAASQNDTAAAPGRPQNSAASYYSGLYAGIGYEYYQNGNPALPPDGISTESDGVDLQYTSSVAPSGTSWPSWSFCGEQTGSLFTLGYLVLQASVGSDTDALNAPTNWGSAPNATEPSDVNGFGEMGNPGHGIVLDQAPTLQLQSGITNGISGANNGFASRYRYVGSATAGYVTVDTEYGVEHVTESIAANSEQWLEAGYGYCSSDVQYNSGSGVSVVPQSQTLSATGGAATYSITFD